MTNEPNNEQARELSEKELEGIAGGTMIGKVGKDVGFKFGVTHDYQKIFTLDHKITVLSGSDPCLPVT